jgi:hypothetical protein
MQNHEFPKEEKKEIEGEEEQNDIIINEERNHRTEGTVIEDNSEATPKELIKDEEINHNIVLKEESVTKEEAKPRKIIKYAKEQEVDDDEEEEETNHKIDIESEKLKYEEINKQEVAKKEEISKQGLEIDINKIKIEVENENEKREQQEPEDYNLTAHQPVKDSQSQNIPPVVLNNAHLEKPTAQEINRIEEHKKEILKRELGQGGETCLLIDNYNNNLDFDKSYEEWEIISTTSIIDLEPDIFNSEIYESINIINDHFK